MEYQNTFLKNSKTWDPLLAHQAEADHHLASNYYGGSLEQPRWGALPALPSQG